MLMGFMHLSWRPRALVITVLLHCAWVCMLQVELLAEPTTPSQAQILVARWLAHDREPMGSSLGKCSRDVQTYLDADGKPVYFVVRLQPSGFVIVSGDDMVEPIVGFSPEGDYDPSSDNPLGALVSRDLPSRVGEIRGLQAQAARHGRQLAATGTHGDAQKKWRMFLSGGPTPAGISTASLSDIRIDPLIQSKWDQSNECGAACYNYYTPPDAPGSTTNYYAGCVATAMAQLMRFYQYPAASVGTAVFDISVCGIAQTESIRGGDGIGGPYQWSDMVLDPDCSITLAQRQAIGALCHDAGVAARMDFCNTGSGAYMLNASTAMRSTFQYSSSKIANTSSSLALDKLYTMINPNLDAGFPVMLGITRPGSGHAVVCDGYGYNASTIYHHLNMGWSGTDNVWYNLPNIDASHAYDSVCDCVYNVYPSGTGEIISGRVLDTSGNPIGGALVSAGVYSDMTDSRGIYALAKVASGSTYVVAVQKQGYVFPTHTITVGTSPDWGNNPGNVWGVDFTTQAVETLTDAKDKPDGNSTAYQGAILTAVFGDWFYVEAQDRSGGILVHKTGHGLVVGKKTDVIGTLATNADGERYVEASSAAQWATGMVMPLGMTAKALGGADWNWSPGGSAGQMGVKDGTGLNNVGLLVRIAGDVQYVDTAGAFAYISDGSELSDGNTLGEGGAPMNGVRVILPTGVVMPPAGTHVMITGISSLGTVNSAVVRVLKVRAQSDVSTSMGAMVMGRVTQGGDQVINDVIESPHNYPDKYNNTWTLAGPAETTRIRVHFTQIQVETSYDHLYVQDSSNTTQQTFSNSVTAWDVWSNWVTGNTLKLNLVSDYSVNYYGFSVDKYEADIPVSPVSGATLTLTPSGQTVMSGTDGYYRFDALGPGSYTVTPSPSGATFNPPSLAFDLLDWQYFPGVDFVQN